VLFRSGRAYLYGLGAYGETGVTKALEILKDELDVAMALTGVTDVEKVPRSVILRPPKDEISFTGEGAGERTGPSAFRKQRNRMET